MVRPSSASALLMTRKARGGEVATRRQLRYLTAALGIACGLGRRDVVVIGTAIALLLLVAASWTDKWMGRLEIWRP